MNRRRATAILAALAMLALACEGGGGDNGEKSGNGRANPGATRLVTPRVPANTPNPNPDTRAKTPAPVAADPDPHDWHVYGLLGAWSPAHEFVEIDWQMGNSQPFGGPFEKRDGSWSKVERRHGKQFISISLKWTDYSWERVSKQGGRRLVCDALVDGKRYGRAHHIEDTGRRIQCSVFAGDIP